jgi:alkylmercury lyase
MTTHLGDVNSLDALAGLLAPTFPGRDDAPLSRALLAELAQGAPVDVAELARRAGRDERHVREALARWPNVQHDDDRDRVIAFGGLSIVPTPHRFALDGRTLYTWCAWDTLFLPALLGHEAHVQSTCPVTGTDIALTVAPDGVRESQPDDLWVSFPPPDQTSTADITGSFCCHVHFLADEAAAATWLADHGDGLTLSLSDAFELGRLATQAFDTSGAEEVG